MKNQRVTIQENVGNFYQRWKDYSKNERKGYQTFLGEFFSSFGITFEDPNKLPFEVHTGNGFADAYIKDVVIIEMKDRNKFKTSKDLEKCLPQALKYWEAKGKHVPYLVLCNFDDFIIFDTRDGEKHHIKLAELETRIETFDFLRKINPQFIPEQEAVTKKSARLMGELYRSLRNRIKNRDNEVDIFVLQCLFCLFSEDIGYLPSQTFTNCIRRIKDGEDNSANILSTLFKMMDEKDSVRKKGRFENVRYFNGPLFRIRPEFILDEKEVKLLWDSCELNWIYVRPEIFGALFESAQTKSDRHKDGMHFTSEDDIMKVVGPCIIDPWNDKLSRCKTTSDYRQLHKNLKSYRVLDPACGSGNFLIVAYRAIKRLENRIFNEYKRLSDKSYKEIQDNLGWYPVTNMYGIELNDFPAFLTKVSLWITKKMLINEFKLTEDDLPLEELKHIYAADALKVKWDDVDVVVGNPPYIGYSQIRKARGDEYFDWLSKRFKDHNQMSDYCTYWFEKVLEDVRAGVLVGLVCTKTISQTNSRVASLEKIITSGGVLFNVISHQKWSGEAKVHISIVNFMNKRGYEGRIVLDYNTVKQISSRLKNFATAVNVSQLNENKNLSFLGVSPQGMGFIINKNDYQNLISNNTNNIQVIKKYLTGEDLVQNYDQSPSRWIIDFQDWTFEQTLKYSEPLKIVKKLVKPTREKNRIKKRREMWWRFASESMSLRRKIEGLKRFICLSRVSKYPIFVFIENKNILPADATVTIAFDDYEHLGVLSSKFHADWCNYQASSLKGDLRYTNTTVFETFPFPKKISSSVAKIMEQLDDYRRNTCKKEKIGLTTLYNQMYEGGHVLLKKLHDKLNDAVAESYGFPKNKILVYEDIIKFLVDLNIERFMQQESEESTVQFGKDQILKKAYKNLSKAEKKSNRKSA